MVSLQTADSAWMAFAEHELVPHASEYIAPYKTSAPSYPTFSEPVSTTDLRVLDVLAQHPTSFASAYRTYARAFGPDERYTLFVPLSSPRVDALLRMRAENEGFSHKNAKLRAEADLQLEHLLRRHMVPVRILPAQLEYRNTTVATHDAPVNINARGELGAGNRVESYLVMPHATLFFITRELE
jgi:hypothetical protein